MSLIESMPQYVMRGNKQALLLLVPLACLPFCHWLAVALLAFLALRKGLTHSVLPLLGVVLPNLALAIFLSMPALFWQLCVGDLLVWLGACLLRITVDWVPVLLLYAFTAILAVLVLHVGFPEIILSTQQLLKKSWDVYGAQAMVTAQQRQEVHDFWQAWLLPMANGIQLLVFVMGNALALWGGRLFQARLYHPGGVRAEWLALRLSAPVCFMWLLLWAGLLFCLPEVAFDALPLFLWVPFLSGLSVTHALLVKKGVAAWQVGLFYVFLALFFPYWVIILSGLAMCDGWFDFRSRAFFMT